MALIGSEGGTWPPSATPQGGPVKEYEVEINGVATTLQLTDADAEARGLKQPAAKAKTAPANKEAAKPANKAAAPSKQAGGAKA